MTKLLTVLALNLRVVSRFGALLRKVTHLVAVAALDVGGILWLITFLEDMILGATVAASALLNIGALWHLSMSIAV